MFEPLGVGSMALLQRQSGGSALGRVGSKELLQDGQRLCPLLGRTCLGLSNHLLLSQSLNLSLFPLSKPVLIPNPSCLAQLFVPF